MTATVRQLKRQAAKRPAPRTVTVTVADGDFAGWELTGKADFRSAVLEEFEAASASRSLTRLIGALEAVVIDHNLPNEQGDIAERLADVDPYQGLLKVADLFFEAIVKLPNR